VYIDSPAVDIKRPGNSLIVTEEIRDGSFYVLDKLSFIFSFGCDPGGETLQKREIHGGGECKLELVLSYFGVVLKSVCEGNIPIGCFQRGECVEREQLFELSWGVGTSGTSTKNSIGAFDTRQVRVEKEHMLVAAFVVTFDSVAAEGQILGQFHLTRQLGIEVSTSLNVVSFSDGELIYGALQKANEVLGQAVAEFRVLQQVFLPVGLWRRDLWREVHDYILKAWVPGD